MRSDGALAISHLRATVSEKTFSCTDNLLALVARPSPGSLRWAAVEAAHQSWRPSNPWHELYTDLTKRHGKNPAKSAVARKILIAAWHVLSRDQPFKPSRPRGTTPVSASSHCFLAA